MGINKERVLSIANQNFQIQATLTLINSTLSKETNGLHKICPH